MRIRFNGEKVATTLTYNIIVAYISVQIHGSMGTRPTFILRVGSGGSPPWTGGWSTFPLMLGKHLLVSVIGVLMSLIEKRMGLAQHVQHRIKSAVLRLPHVSWEVAFCRKAKPFA